MPVAVDLGFGWTKAIAGERTFLEPSVVGPSAPVIEGMGGPKGIRLCEPDGREFFVGRLAMDQSRNIWHSLGDDKPGNLNTKRLLQAALGCVAPFPNGPWTIDWLVSGLPIQLVAKQQQDLENLLGSFQNSRVQVRVDSRNIDLSITVKGVYVVPQPFGSLLDLVMNDQGVIVRDDLAEAKILVVDVGFHSVCVFRSKSSTCFARKRPPVPAEIVHQFRSKSSSDSGPIRPPISAIRPAVSEQAVHGFRAKSSILGDPAEGVALDWATAITLRA